MISIKSLAQTEFGEEGLNGLVQMIEAVTIFLMRVLPFGFLCGTLWKIHCNQSIHSTEADVNAIIPF
ncbi:hypothetical protein HMPREF1987_00210 [Peptostreptococcaceae bacterium oral taxon 113 str. W5053]|nr:hypothetical protein HMPREF1987_00210 [Peptostreptococcaceae bacterium oral taxon 113 str. W5053]